MGAEMLEVDARSLALSGGEDYELLATLQGDAVEAARADLQAGFGVDLSEIGEIVEGSSVVALDADGRTTLLAPWMGSLRPGVAWLSWTMTSDHPAPGCSRSLVRTRAAAPGSRPT